MAELVETIAILYSTCAANLPEPKYLPLDNSA